MVEPSTLELQPPPVRSLAHHDADADADADADGISTSSLSGRLYFVPKKVYFAPELHVHVQVLSTGTSSSCGAPPSCSGSGLYRFPILS